MWRPCVIAARGEHRLVVGLRQLDDLGDEREGAHPPGVPGGVLPLRHDQVEALLQLARRLAGEADQPPDLDAGVVQHLQGEGRAAHAGGEDRDLLLDQHVELGARLAQQVDALDAPRAGRLRLRDAVLAHHAVDEVPVLLRDLRHQLLRGALDVRGGEQEVDAERLVADALADPVDVVADLLRRQRVDAVHADAAGVRHRGDHVSGVGEADERNLAAVLVAKAGLHRVARHRSSPFT